MRRAPRWAGAVAALFTAFQAAACGDYSLTDPRPVAPPTGGTAGVAITFVEAIRAGQPVEVKGKGLSKLTHLTVAGEAVAFQVKSDSVATFTGPSESGCITDGTPLEVVANHSAKAHGAVRAEKALRLQVGESRILSAQDLACLQIAAGAEDYLLSVGSHTGAKVLDSVFRLRTPGGMSATGQSVSQSVVTPGLNLMAGGDAHAGHAHMQALNTTPVNTLSASAEVVPFDNYAGAKAGDIVNMVDWDNPAVLRATAVADLPTFQGRVVAVTAGQIFVVDTRAPTAAEFSTQAARDKFTKAGEIADRHMLPALRAVIDPQLVLPRDGAGGKMMNILQSMPAGTAGGVRAEEVQRRPGASHMYASRLSTALLTSTPEVIAGVVIHEAAHIADGYDFYRNNGGRSAGWHMEALAVSVEDMAARMAMGSQHPRSTDNRADVPHSGIRYGPSPSAPTQSPWGAAGSSIGAGGPGAYDRGARILRYAQQKAGELGFTRSGTTLYQRMRVNSDRFSPTQQFDDWVRAWNIDAIAAAVGMTAQQLLDESMMADLTDDLVAGSHNLPQNQAWNQAPAGGGLPISRRISRGGTFDENVQVPAGGYAYWYVPAGDGARGLSLQASNVALQPHHQVKLTRLR